MRDTQIMDADGNPLDVFETESVVVLESLIDSIPLDYSGVTALRDWLSRWLEETTEKGDERCRKR